MNESDRPTEPADETEAAALDPRIDLSFHPGRTAAMPPALGSATDGPAPTDQAGTN